VRSELLRVRQCIARLDRWRQLPPGCMLSLAVRKVLPEHPWGIAMSDDSGTMQPITPAEPAAFREPAAEGSKKAGDSWWKRWRSVFLFCITAALALLSFVLWHSAATGKEDASLEADTPQLLGVFSTDPNTVIRLTADVFWHNVSGYARAPFEEVYVSVAETAPKKSSALLVTSTLQPNIVTGPPGHIRIIPDRAYQSALFYSGTAPFSSLGPPQYVSELPLQQIERDARFTQYGFPIGTFELPEVTQESHGNFFAHLPEIGIYTPTNGAFPLPYLISEGSSSSGQEQLIEGPVPKNPTTPAIDYVRLSPSQYQAPPGRHLLTIYWQPASLTTTEILEDVKSEVENATVNSIVPDGSLQGNNYVWQGQGFLEPTMSLTNQDVAASHSTWIFFSGIAFGVAGGTLVAYIQEEHHPVLMLIVRRLRRFRLRVRAWAGSRRVRANRDREGNTPHGS
jgi:hypothetical protein